MACYSGAMPACQPLPNIWLITDVRNDTALEGALQRLPRGSGLIYRHYHLPAAQRRARFDQLARLARRYCHRVILAGSARQARRWGADGVYGPARLLAHGPQLLRLVTVHSAAELMRVRRANAVLLSPVFPTRSHPEAQELGPNRFYTLAALARVPVIALGGMDRARAKRLGWRRWAAIDAFSR